MRNFRSKAELMDAVTSTPGMAAWAVRKLYARQTWSEKQARDTHNRNGVGFDKPDGAVLVDMWQRALRYGGTFTPRQLRWQVYPRLEKYHAQLWEIYLNGE